MANAGWSWDSVAILDIIFWVTIIAILAESALGFEMNLFWVLFWSNNGFTNDSVGCKLRIEAVGLYTGCISIRCRYRNTMYNTYNSGINATCRWRKADSGGRSRILFRRFFSNSKCIEIDIAWWSGWWVIAFKAVKLSMHIAIGSGERTLGCRCHSNDIDITIGRG